MLEYVLKISTRPMRTREEYDKIKVFIQDETICPFCDKNLVDKELLFKGKYWAILYNKYPYLGLKKHLLLIPRRHIFLTCELESNEWTEMNEIETWMKNYYGDEPYFSFIRQIGKQKSIAHLHYHYLPGEVPVSGIEAFLKHQNLN